MPASAIVKLRRGARVLDLNSGNLRVGASFAPPATQIVPQIATGTSANRRRGGRKAGERAVDQRWSFGLHVVDCASPAEVIRELGKVEFMLSMAGDESEPLYLEFKPTSVEPAPLWGQDRYFYEIVHGSVPRVSPEEAYGFLLGQGYADVDVSCVIKPYALGLKQRLASATGGVLLDTLGTADGRARGVIITPFVANIHTNPVFGNATWNNAWTAAANLVESQNTDPAYLLHETRSSAKLTARGATNNTYTQSITLAAATRTLSYIVMLPDGGTPSSADVVVHYNGSDQTTAFTSLGNGRWRISASVTGTGGAAATGITVKNGRTIYLLQAQAEANDYATTPFWGDLAGCSWVGTVHASASNRGGSGAPGRIRLAVAADTFSLAQGAIVLAWKAPFANTHANDLFLFSCGATNLRARFESGDDKFYFSDNTTEISTSAQTFSAGDVLWLAFVWGPSGLAIYKNGASAASNGTYTPPALPSYVYIGSDDTPANQGYGPFMDFRLYGEELTAAEVLADYTNRVQVTNDGQRAGELPWLWTKDGDDVVDNHDDSGDDNWCVVAGVPGSAPAETEITLTTSGGKAAFWLSLGMFERFAYPSGQVYSDLSGTAAVGTGSGDAIRTNSSVNLQTQAIADPDLFEGEYVFFTRLKSAAGASVSLSAGFVLGSTSIVAPTFTFTADTTYRLYKLGHVNIMRQKLLDPTKRQLYISVGALLTGTFEWDYYMALPRPLAKIVPSVAGSADQYVLRGQDLMALTAATGLPAITAALQGDLIEFAPDRFNVLWFVSGDHAESNALADTGTFSRVRVTPRYALL